MAEEFQLGVCGGSWWNTARSTTGLDGSPPPPAASAATMASSVSCSNMQAIGDNNNMKSYGDGWPMRWSCDQDQPATVASSSVSDPVVTGDFSVDSTRFGLSPPTLNWSRNDSRGADQSSFNAMLQEQDLRLRAPYLRQGSAMGSNQTFLVDQSDHLSSSTVAAFSGGCTVNSFPVVSASFRCPPSTSSFLQGLLIEHDPKSQPTINQFQFSNNTRFWNASTATTIDNMGDDFYSSSHNQLVPLALEEKANCSSITVESNSEDVRDSTSSTKKSSNEPAIKKARIATPSPLPTFKVRKEKLGDRITALQQLVSPFGKTDTASVLYEAIEYIKLLHDQVNVLSTPYLKNGPPMQHQQNSDKSKDGEGPKQDLRSRGLCLVPISSTFPVANEPMADFWTPTFGVTYR